MPKHYPPTETQSASPGDSSVAAGNPTEEGIGWREQWRVLIERKKRVATIMVASTLVALLAAIVMTSIYRAEVLLVLVPDESSSMLGSVAGQFSDLAALGGINLAGKKDKTAEYIAVLKSRAAAVTFINQENLKPILFPRKWDKEKKSWQDGDAPSEWEAFDVFDKEIRIVNVDRRTGLVTLAIEWRDPTLAAKWANAFVKHVNSRLRAEATDEADKGIQYLERQLKETSSVEVQQAIYKMIEAQAKKKMIASTREEYAFRVIDGAVPPEKKIRPNVLLIIALGALAGLMTGVATVLWRRPE